LRRSDRQRLSQIALDIFDAFQADRESHHSSSNAGVDAILFGNHVVGEASRMLNQRVGGAQADRRYAQFDGFHECRGRVIAASQFKANQAAAS